MSSRTIKTRYGNIKGALMEFSNSNLKPIESFKGLQYGTLYGGRLRFMPPTSPLERWKYTRVAFSLRPVCTQKALNENNLFKDIPKFGDERLKRISPYTLQQSEDCLTLNLYVPIPDIKTQTSDPDIKTQTSCPDLRTQTPCKEIGTQISYLDIGF
ncbi:hypothetical protein CHS0354_017502 [Potamilus streckersoni]|uniref:Carboxylesterase type B domain-containing protein n=1 Tax=Potamilus streckersoni TaxID=2493646 RepID=A0AAE0RY65_9BIVA|nr:hypothetical protein CHS0354_017502 [Potamilus streckersoni]